MHEQVESIIKYSTQRWIPHYLVSEVSTQGAGRERRISIEKASAPDFHRYRSEHRKDGGHARSSPPVCQDAPGECLSCSNSRVAHRGFCEQNFPSFARIFRRSGGDHIIWKPSVTSPRQRSRSTSRTRKGYEADTEISPVPLKEGQVPDQTDSCRCIDLESLSGAAATVLPYVRKAPWCKPAHEAHRQSSPQQCVLEKAWISGRTGRRSETR